MTVGHTATALTGAVDLFERAVGYTRQALQFVTPAAMTRPTPCAEWDLRALLRHMDDSLAALTEAADVEYVGLEPSFSAYTGIDLVDGLRGRACALLGAWAGRDGDGAVSVAGARVPAEVLAPTGALEVAVHGWDVARACGRDHQMPSGLADELLELAPLLVSPHDRPGRFDVPVDVRSRAAPGDRLVAFLGRSPREIRQS